jgi:hypothetical protein
MDLDYIASEQFIHDQLVLRCVGMLERALEAWTPKLKVNAVAVAWPGEEIQDDVGIPIRNKVVLPFRSPSADAACVRELAQRTRAFGLFVVEEKDQGLYALFESPKGTVAWAFRVETHGDVRVLGTPKVTIDTDSFGLLWKPPTKN